MIALRGVSFGYPGQEYILDHVDLTMPEQGICAVMGPSGSAKTTLLRLIAGLEKPTEGTISGRDEQKIIMMFQEDRLLPWCTVLENVMLGMPSPVHQTARHLLTLVELDDVADHYPQTLSGGMRRRVALARAVAAEPDILLLDEPFNGLDTDVKLRISPFLRNAAKLIVFTTHDGDEVKMMETERIFRIEGKNIIKL